MLRTPESARAPQRGDGRGTPSTYSGVHFRTVDMTEKKKKKVKKKSGSAYSRLYTPEPFSVAGSPISTIRKEAHGRPETPSAALVDRMLNLASRGPTPSQDLVRKNIDTVAGNLFSKIEAVEKYLRAADQRQKAAAAADDSTSITSEMSDVEEVYAHRLQFLLELQNRMGLLDKKQRERFTEEGIQCSDEETELELSQDVVSQGCGSDLCVEEEAGVDAAVDTSDLHDDEQPLAVSLDESRLVDVSTHEVQTDFVEVVDEGRVVMDRQALEESEAELRAEVEKARAAAREEIAALEAAHEAEAREKEKIIEELSTTMNESMESVMNEKMEAVSSHAQVVEGLTRNHDEYKQRMEEAEAAKATLEADRDRANERVAELQRTLEAQEAEGEKSRAAMLKEVHTAVAKQKQSVREKYFEAMKSGCLMYKCKRKMHIGFRRAPSVRWVFISHDVKAICWHKHADAVGKERRELPLKAISRIVYGAKTMAQLTAKRTPELPVWLSFSVVFVSGETLDLVAPDTARLVSWLLGLQLMVARLKGRNTDGRHAITRGWIYWRMFQYKLQESASALGESISAAAKHTLTRSSSSHNNLTTSSGSSYNLAGRASSSSGLRPAAVVVTPKKR